LVGLQPDIIMTQATPPTAALQQETRTIPIVTSVAEPVASGVVPRLDRPNRTINVVSYEATLGGKWLELLSEIAPGLKRAAIMFNPDSDPVSLYFMPSFETAAQSLKVEAINAPVHSDVEIETAIMDLGREPGGGLVVTSGVFTFAHRAPIILAAARNNVSTVYPNSAHARDGGLLSYGPDQIGTYRGFATYVDRILRGATLAELPV
jgi:putative ABC transport system substrate-binding protein